MKSTIKNQIADYITGVVKKIALSRNIEIPAEFSVRIEYPPRSDMGQYASPAAMMLARYFKQKPADLAGEILKELNQSQGFGALVGEARIEGPGFLNFFLHPDTHRQLLFKTFQSPDKVRELMKVRQAHRIIFEFVSANPTGPLNIVSARAAAVGDAICRSLSAAGHEVHREYYVNDYGNQVKLLGISFAVRYLQKKGVSIDIPENGYQGEYIKEVLETILKELSPDENSRLEELSDREKHRDIDEMPEMLGDFFAPRGIEHLRQSHEKDLIDFGVQFDLFFSEKTLHEKGAVEAVLEKLKAGDHIYEEDGALCFASTKFGDDKDRVVVRSDSRPTYLLADIAYHESKIERGFNRIYNIWGPDHHGYIARLKGAMTALGFGAGQEGQDDQEDEKFEVFIVQQVNMLEGGQPVVMSKRLGQFHTMRDLLEKIPVDVIRYFFIMRSQSSHLDFDLDLALTESNKNPVYYIQYAGARISSIIRESGEQQESSEIPVIPDEWWTAGKRSELLAHLWRYPEVVQDVSASMEVHLLCEYLYETANVFTDFYHQKENRVIEKLRDNPEEGALLLAICRCVRMVIADGLSLLGISSPERM